MKKEPNISFRGFVELLARFGLDSFLLSLITVIVLAYIHPSWGARDSFLPLNQIAKYGVSLIFFFYGMRLSPDKLREGLGNWKLHLLVQSATFLIFPVVVFVFYLLLGGSINNPFWLGVLYLAALPSTVSSSVVMVSIAGGNMPAAIFNASISSLIGVFMTPLWMAWFLKSNTQSFSFGDAITDLTLQVLLPIILGVILHKRFGAIVEKYKKNLRYMDQSIILLIVYTSFCESFERDIFKSFSAFKIIFLGLSMITLFFLVYFIVSGISKILRFKPEDRITAIFCGSKKSLVHGTVMSKVLFPNSSIIGIMILPLMLYHALQLLASSIISQSIARKSRPKN